VTRKDLHQIKAAISGELTSTSETQIARPYFDVTRRGTETSEGDAHRDNALVWSSHQSRKWQAGSRRHVPIPKDRASQRANEHRVPANPGHRSPMISGSCYAKERIQSFASADRRKREGKYAALMSADSYLEISRSIIWFSPSAFCLPFAICVGGTSPVFVSDVIMGIMYFSSVAIDGAIQVEMKTQSAESALGAGVCTPMGIRQVVPPTSGIAHNRIADNEALRPHPPPYPLPVIK